MKEVKTKLKKEVITRKVFTDEFATTYQYLIVYANELINNLDLFGKIINNENSTIEGNNWFRTFYIKKMKNGFEVYPTLSNDEIINDYKIYREFVISELKRVKPLIDMHYFSMLGAVKDLDTVRKKIDTYKLI